MDLLKDNAMDLAIAPLSQQLISSITEELMRAADNVVQLHSRLTVESVDQSTEMNKSYINILLNGLQGAIGEAQKKLRLVNSASENNIASKRKDL